MWTSNIVINCVRILSWWVTGLTLDLRGCPDFPSPPYSTLAFYPASFSGFRKPRGTHATMLSGICPSTLLAFTSASGFPVGAPPLGVTSWSHTGRGQRERKGTHTDCVSIHSENHRLPQGSPPETSDSIHWPEIGHVVTAGLRESGGMNICNWAQCHSGEKKIAEVLLIGKNRKVNNEESQ